MIFFITLVGGCSIFNIQSGSACKCSGRQSYLQPFQRFRFHHSFVPTNIFPRLVFGPRLFDSAVESCPDLDTREISAAWMSSSSSVSRASSNVQTSLQNIGFFIFINFQQRSCQILTSWPWKWTTGPVEKESSDLENENLTMIIISWRCLIWFNNMNESQLVI